MKLLCKFFIHTSHKFDIYSLSFIFVSCLSPTAQIGNLVLQQIWMDFHKKSLVKRVESTHKCP